eukprot:TRINITY_DN81234_c0_g1_i1.p1 TRINITY_DN81234_c0_g1~~TRINITY_DN81234_c0_g1_i1.p1  ORF type:complete len:120 (-),score=30.73 TRINITY_DN81234_c0_g1_i1:127-486(-)
MKVSVKCTSGTYALEADKDDLVSELVARAREQHPRPSWATGVQLKFQDQGEDLLEASAGRTLQDVGVRDGSLLRMQYYQQVQPEMAKAMRLGGMEPSSGVYLLIKKDTEVTSMKGIGNL